MNAPATVPQEVVDAAKASILEEPPERTAFDRLVALCAEHKVSIITATTEARRQLIVAGALVAPKESA